MGIKDLLARWKATKDKEKELETDVRIQRRVMDRQKTNDERELETYKKEEHDAMIKKQLQHYRAKERDKTWRNTTILNNNNSLIKDKYLFKQKNIFSGGCR